MDFIVVSNPGQRASAKTTRQAHSHAARVAHARVRRQNMAEYKTTRAVVNNFETKNNARDASSYRSESEMKKSSKVPHTLPGGLQPEGISHFRQHLSPIEHFIFDHCKFSTGKQSDFTSMLKQVVDIQTVLPAQISYCPIVMGLKEEVMDIRSHWMLFIASDPIILRGFLLAACRHLSLVELQGEFVDMAIRYKLSYLRGLQQCMFVNDPSSRRKAVSMTTVLAFDEVRSPLY